MDRRAKDTDDLARMMAEDDLADQAELGKMSVREYAKSKGMEPQLVYYYIRTGKIKDEMCVCGRRVVDVESADAFLSEREAKAKEKAGGVVIPEEPEDE